MWVCDRILKNWKLILLTLTNTLTKLTIMKKINIFYWITTSLLALLMANSGIMSLLQPDQSKKFMTELLGFPAYMIVFLSVAKILGSITILIPAPSKLKEWAYAGLFFDLTGAFYSLIAKQLNVGQTVGMFVVFYIIFFASYILYSKRQNLMANQA